MRKIEYTETEKVHIVQELIDGLRTKEKVTPENYLRQFAIVMNTMIENLGFDPTQKNEVANKQFHTYMHTEFLPQYAIILWFNLKNYQADLQKKMKSRDLYF